MHFSHLASCKLRDAKHSVDKQDRPKLLNLLRKVVYAETKTDLQVCLEELNLTCLKYQQYQRHLTEDTFPYRVTNSLPTSDNNTNNLVETSFRYTKEKQFNRHKAYNLPDMLSLIGGPKKVKRLKVSPIYHLQHGWKSKGMILVFQ